MTPIHSHANASNPSSYIFSAMRRADGQRPTVIECVVPSPPRRVRSVQLSAVRTFKLQPISLSRRKQMKTRDQDNLPGASEDELSSSTIPSSSPPPASSVPTVVAHARSPERATSSASAQQHRPAVRLTRSASRSSNKTTSKDGRRSSAIDLRLKPDGGIVTRFGEQDGEPIFIRQERVTSTTEPDVVTYFWESFTAVPLVQPPNLTMYPDLAVGDLYCNIVKGDVRAVPQLWIWTMGADGVGYWKRAREGDVREDGRRLTITPKRKQPSWVSPNWGVKQLRNQKAR